MSTRKISRREFLYTGVAATAGAALVACGQPQTIVVETEKEVTVVVEKEKEVEKIVKETVVVEKEKEVTKVVEKEVEKEVVVTATAVPPAQEAPSVERMVAAGQIPPLEERIPTSPHTVEGLDGIGKYGGIWRLGKSGQADGYARGQVTERGLTKYNQDLELVNQLCESWEVTPDAKTWTFHLRKGVKWHDGEPHTSEDWMYLYYDVVSNREITGAHPTALVSFVDGERVPAVLEAPDAFTITWKFEMPKALFNYVGGYATRSYSAQPKHHNKQYHADYADKADLDALVEAESLEDWTQLHGVMNNIERNQDRPVVDPWVEVNDWTNEVIWLDRNPYFWTVDTAGNQLPYIERLQYRSFSDSQIYMMWVVNGEIDCQSRHARSWGNFTTLKENEATGDYGVQLWRGTRVASIHFNMTTKNERLAELFKERDYRIAISHACDRDEMIDLLMDGNATKMQYSPPADSPYYWEEFAKSHLEYDPDLANEMLDNLGYTERDSEGYRTFKDGSGDRISMTALGGGTEPGSFMLMLIDYFRDVGLQLNWRGMDRALRIEMHQSNEVEMTAGEADRNLIPLADPQIWIKHTNISDRPWCNAWTAWYLDPTNPIAEEPPAGHWIWDIWGAWEDLQQTVADDGQKALFRKILEVWKDELPSVGLYGDIPQLVPVKNGFKGIHAGYGWDCCTTSYEHIIDNSTWYWDEPEKHS